MAARQSSGGRIKENVASEVPAKNEMGRGFLRGLPNPEELAKYEKVIPGGAERILEMVETDARHRQEREIQEARNQIRTTRIKQLITFVLVLVAGVFGGVLMVSGSELAGLIIVLIDAVAVVGIAVYGGKIGGV